MADQVTYSNLFSESRNNVVSLITTTNIPDSLVGSAEFRKRIYSREPDVKASGFSGYPYFIVNHTDVEIEEGGSVDGKSKFITWNIEVEIVTSDRAYGNRDGQGASDMDTLSDALVKTFANMTNRKSLSNNSMKFSRPYTTAVVDDVVDNELVFRRSIMLPFRSRIQVSA